MRKIIMLASVTVIALLILASTVSAIGLDLSSSTSDTAPDASIPTEQPEEIVEPVVVEEEDSGDIAPESISTSPTPTPPDPPENQPPVASFNYTPHTPSVNQIITFDATASYDDDGWIAEYHWYWAYPENVDEFWYDIDFWSGPVIEYSFTDSCPHNGSGTYVMILAVVDNEGGNDDEISYDYQTIEVTENKPPVATFTYTPAPPSVNQIITFDATASYDLDGWIVDYDWYWAYPDEVGYCWYPIDYSGKPVIKYSFDTAGTYVVILAVVDNENGSDDEISYDYQTIEVINAVPPGVDIDSQSSQQLETQQIRSQSESSDGLFGSISLASLYGSIQLYTIIKQLQPIIQHLVTLTKYTQPTQ